MFVIYNSINPIININIIYNTKTKLNTMSFQTPMLTNAMYRQMYKPFGEELIARIAKHALNQDPNDEITPERAVDDAMNILNGLLAELGRNTKSIKKSFKTS